MRPFDAPLINTAMSWAPGFDVPVCGNNTNRKTQPRIAYFIARTESPILINFCLGLMPRKAIPPETENQVLLFVRRRCCICYGLNRDLEIKQGQIAHLDQNPENIDLGDLAFLCLLHHDQYDSRTSQSRGLTLNEVRHFRGELHKVIEEAWRQRIRVGQVEVPGTQASATEVPPT
jgi:hypothetical protein